jgi:hypothetical protein
MVTLFSVIPVKAGIRCPNETMNSCFRRNDSKDMI